MLQPELKFRRDKIRSLMVSQGIDAALITCNANLIYTYGCVVSGYLYLPLHSPALLFFAVYTYMFIFNKGVKTYEKRYKFIVSTNYGSNIT